LHKLRLLRELHGNVDLDKQSKVRIANSTSSNIKKF
jgi:hypothetical protein